MAINSLNASSYGLSGLVSGMNTQEMVEKMLSGTKGKIVAQQQKKAQLEYKQELYRGLATQLRTLQTSFFSFSNPTQNLLSSAFFNSMKATTSEAGSKYFHATATTNASAGTTNVDYIKQLAKSAKLTGSKKASAKLSSNTSNQEIRNAMVDFRDNFKAKIKFSIDGPNGVTSKELTQTELRQLAGMSDEDAAATLNNMLSGFGVNVSSANGKLTFSTTGMNENLIISGDEIGKKLLGLGSSSVSGAGSYSTQIDTKQLLPSIQVQLDNGEKKSVYFDYDKYKSMTNDSGNPNTEMQALNAALQEGMTKAFGDAISVDMKGGQIVFDVADQSRTFVITGSEDVMNILGIKSGQSNKMTYGMHLDEINFADKLVGNDFRFTINGVNFHVTGDTTLTGLINQINDSDAGVKLKYNDNNDLFTLESTVSGSGSKITMSQEEGNLLTALFGIEGSTAVSGKSLVNSSSVYSTSNAELKSQGGKISFDITTSDGLRRTVNLTVPAPKKTGEYYTDKQEFINAINETLDKNDEANLAGGIQFKLDSDGKIGIEATAGTKITVKAGAGSLMAELGFTNGQTNGAVLDAADATKSSTLEQAGLVASGGTITIGGQPPLSATASLNELQQALQKVVDDKGKGGRVTWDENESRFRITGVDTSAGAVSFAFGADAKKLFSTSVSSNGTVTLNKATSDADMDAMVSKGQNARVSIDGNEIERSSNDFTYNGITFSLTQTFDKRKKDDNGNFALANHPNEYAIDNDGYYRNKKNHYVLSDGTFADENGNLYDSNGTATGSNIDADQLKDKLTKVNGTEVYTYEERAGQVDVTRDSDQIYNGICKFVDEYNKIMETIHSLLVEDPEYKNYLPLTDEQKSAMSDREVELWEEKSKKGLLRSDTTLNAIWDDLRSTIYKKPSGSDIALYNIGVTTSGSSEYGGQLVISHSTLKEAILSNPEGIRKMFTDSVDGVATALNEAINRAAKSSAASPGRLVVVAGSSKGDTSSSLYKQMKAIDKNLEGLEDRYNAEYNRYWKQFNAMEQMIQTMNQQSSWLAQQFSS